MLSRVAEALFWMSRYLERAENTARMLQANMMVSLDSAEPGLFALVEAAGDEQRFSEHFDDRSDDSVMKFILFDPDNPNSVLRCLHAARSNAQQVREVVPTEFFECLNRLFLHTRAIAFRAEEQGHEQDALCRFVRDTVLQAKGIRDGTMTHDEGWMFCVLAEHLERADATTRILDVKYFTLLPSPGHVGAPIDAAGWSALLRSASALQAYRQEHGHIDPENVAGFLVLDREFPRSVRHCLDRASEILRVLTGSIPGTYTIEGERLLGRLAAELDWTSAAELIKAGLHEKLDDLQIQISEIANAVQAEFFVLGDT